MHRTWTTKLVTKTARTRKNKGRIDAKGGEHEFCNTPSKTTKNLGGSQKHVSNKYEISIITTPTGQNIHKLGLVAFRDPETCDFEGVLLPGKEARPKTNGIPKWRGVGV